MLTRCFNRLDRASFKIFDSLAKKTPKTEVEQIADEILTLSLTELAELAEALNRPEVLSKNFFPSNVPLGKNRSPFPHPKHVFSGIDANTRPGMHTIPQK